MTTSPALLRLLDGEERISDLIALLAEHDPLPLQRALGLPDGLLRVVREHLVTVDVDAGRKTGRLDLVVIDAGDRPMAAVEVKLGAGQHGMQFDVYESWRAAEGLPPSACWLVTLAGEVPGVPAGWSTELTLAALVGHWRSSEHDGAAWLAGQAADMLQERGRRFDGPLGEAEDGVTAALVVKQLIVDLRRQAAAQGDVNVWRGSRTSGGQPMLIAWLALPGRTSRDISMCLDLRMDRAPQRWLLRLGLEVDATDGRALTDARLLAHRLAVAISARLTRSALADALGDGGRDLAGCLVEPDRRWHDGLQSPPSAAKVDAWVTAVRSGKLPRRHPLLFHDGGTRLGSQLRLDASTLDRHQVLRLAEASLDHLRNVAVDVAALLREGDH